MLWHCKQTLQLKFRISYIYLGPPWVLFYPLTCWLAIKTGFVRGSCYYHHSQALVGFEVCRIVGLPKLLWLPDTCQETLSLHYCQAFIWNRRCNLILAKPIEVTGPAESSLELYFPKSGSFLNLSVKFVGLEKIPLNRLDLNRLKPYWVDSFKSRTEIFRSWENYTEGFAITTIWKLVLKALRFSKCQLFRFYLHTSYYLSYCVYIFCGNVETEHI